jgi:MFS transporter, OFA family, oxalate/formate antiporter
MNEKQAKRTALMVVVASWLAVFCLFGFRATFAVIKVPMGKDMHWSAANISAGYALMMTIYAVTAFFSGMIIDRWGTKPAYFLAAIFGALGFWATSGVHTLPAYYAAYGVLGGIGTGMLWVSSTVSVRKWYIGKDYAKMWGFAFMGGPMAQIVLSLIAKAVIPVYGWRFAWQMLGCIVLVAMLLATVIAKKNPEDYGVKPFGAMPGAVKEEYVWGVGEAFSRYAIWAVIITFLCSLVAEFLVWSQAVSFFVQDLGMSLGKAVNLYSSIGLVGIFSMPIMGIVADKIVQNVGHEAKGRKISLIIGPLVGVVACALLLQTGKSLVFGLLSCFLFAVYWAMIPGGVVGYTGAVYGRKTLGKIWGLATLICMGIGPATGAFLGGYFKDLTGSYRASILFALGSFVISALAASSLPLAAKPRNLTQPSVKQPEPELAVAGRSN